MGRGGAEKIHQKYQNAVLNQREARAAKNREGDNHRSIPDRDYRGFPAGCLVHGTRRYVFERLNVSAEHVFNNAFHGLPVSNLVEDILKKYSRCAF